MKVKLPKIENKKTFYFAIALLYCEIIYWLILFLSNGKLINTYFTTDPIDTSMDYFNMLANMQYDTPYEYNANYPAMCFLVWKLMFLLIPKSIRGVNGFYFRNYIAAQLGYILITLICIIIIWEVLNYIKVSGKFENKLLSIGIILSGPILFTLERGNILLLAFALLMIFILLYDSDNKYLRLIAYICLALSASLKIYPALFGICVLEKKRYKEAGILVLLGILFFILPFFVFEGVSSIKDMLNGIFLATEEQSKAGVGFNFSFSNLIKIIGRVCGLKIGRVSIVFRIMSLIFCCITYIITMKNWQKVFMISLLCIWIPELSYTYMLVLFIIPFLYYLKEEKNNTSFLSYIFGGLFIIMLIPIALPNIETLNLTYNKFPLSFPTLIINIAILVINILIFWEAIYFRIKKHKDNIATE